ncbi:MAG: hypothetical protein ACUVQG_13580 [Thermogutta sp.]
MMRTYQISCECGNQIPVTINQSGTTVPCSCGREVAVPSRRELLHRFNSPQTDESPEEALRSEALPSPLTGWIRLVQLVAGLLILLAIVGLIILYINRPQLPDLRKLPPAVAYHYFRALQKEEPSPLFNLEVRYVRDRNIWLTLRTLILVVGAVGVVLFVGVTLAGWWEFRSLLPEEAENGDGADDTSPPLSD